MILITAGNPVRFVNRFFFSKSDSILYSVLPQMVDFGSEQGLSDFETGGIAFAMLRISK